MAAKLPSKQGLLKAQTNCEVAAEVISEYFAMVAQAIAAEREQQNPNEGKIKTLSALLSELYKEKLDLGPENEDLINKIIYRYAPLLKRTESHS